MSCIRFNTAAQQRQLDQLTSDPRLSEQAVAAFLSPDVTESKLARLVAMAKDRRHVIRESAALHKHTPVESMRRLARDRVESVRVCLARNEATPCDILRQLATDPSPTVRSWVAVNYFVPLDVVDMLADDPSDEVRTLVAWKTALRDQENEKSPV